MVAIALAIAGVCLGAASPAVASDPAAGEQAFKRLCTSCHIATAEGKRGVGPTLWNVVGRKSGSVEGFRYSTANQNINIVWTPEILDKYLANPRAVVSGTTMAFAGIRNDAERANVIAYLQTLK
ncbi:MAG: cytochrome c family protein [Alphaproteobacteria bacterium]|nr:cytochrome c family protein [Alphaproteobacteria bacterium]